jgi:predicted PurR-regulated permease PerM
MAKGVLMSEPEVSLKENDNNTQKNMALFASQNHTLLITLVVFVIIYTLYFAKSLFIPIVISGFVALLLSPIVSFLKTMHVPRTFSGIALIVIIALPLAVFSLQLAEPAQRWAQTIPKLSAHLNKQLSEFDASFAELESAELAKAEQGANERPEEKSWFDWFSSDEPEQVQIPQKDTNAVSERIKQGGTEVLLSLLVATPLLLAQIAGCIILILFLLVFGPALFETFVQTFPHIKNRDNLLKTVSSIQNILSRYISTISMINSLLGLFTGVFLHLLGVQDAFLWGVFVAIMNFIPYVGSLFSVAALIMAGIVQYGLDLMALLPSAVFLTLNILESQFITPTVLGKNMRLNPLIIIVWLSALGWLWGVLGVLLGVPLLVSAKIILSQFPNLSHWVALAEARGS